MFPPIAGVSRETHDVLASYANLLLQWNKTHNLISKKSEPDIWRRHIEDSVQLFELAPETAKSWIDLGSGAGLPGIVAAIVARECSPEMSFTLVESNKKKSTFLQTAARSLDLKIKVENRRIESVASSSFDVVSARALTSLDNLLDYASRFRSDRTICLFPKGQAAEKELIEARKRWKISHRAIPSRTDDTSVILRIQEYDHVRAPRRMSSSKTFAIVNQKGGVGKTTTAVNLGTALAAAGYETLLLDLDPQGNASTGLGVSASERSITTYDVMVGEATLPQAIIQTDVPNLFLAPAAVELSGADMELIDNPRRAHTLSDALSGLPKTSSGDGRRFVLIDCPPSLNLLTINALASAQGVLVPLQCEFYALEGLSQLLETIRRVKRNLNPSLEVDGVILTMHDRRNNLSAQVAADVRAYLGDLVFETIIPRNVRLSEAPSHAMPALIYDHACTGSQAYIQLASELLRREGTTNKSLEEA